jgi:hypothetical protein
MAKHVNQYDDKIEIEIAITYQTNESAKAVADDGRIKLKPLPPLPIDV